MRGTRDLLEFVWYGAVRSILETFRIGYDWTFFGVPTAVLVGMAAVAFGIVTIVWRHRGPGPTTADLDRLRERHDAGTPEAALTGRDCEASGEQVQSRGLARDGLRPTQP